jgi:hypothetical protein
MTARANSWRQEEDDIIMSGISVEAASDLIGRTAGAISTRRGLLRDATREDFRQYIKDHWATDKPYEISSALRIKDNVTHLIAQQLGLGPSASAMARKRRSGHEASLEAAKGVPDKPKGYSKDVVAQAMREACPPRLGGTSPDQEAGMMLQMHADRKRLKLSWIGSSPVLGAIR